MGLFQKLKNAGGGKRPAVRVPEGPPAPVVRKRCRFSGLVQGVGFRYEAMYLAGQLNLAGWAQNQSDGTVTVEIEGEERCAAEFLRAMRAVPRFDITDIEIEDLPPTGTGTAFRVLY